MARKSREIPTPDPLPPNQAPVARGGRTQMTDLARLAGVSVATVSRALSGNPMISAETRSRVVDLARALNYSVNVGARNLRRGHSRTVAVIVPFDAISGEHLSDPFFLGLIGGIADALSESGHDMLLSRVDSKRLELAARPIESGSAAGVIVIGQWRAHDQLNAMAARGLPFVVWGGRLDNQLYPTVGSDNASGGQIATAHLLDRGARRIAFFGDPDLPEVGQRHAGYLQALSDRGIAADSALTRRVPFVTERIRAAVTELVESGSLPDAIFASSDLMAMATIQTLQRLGLRVPGDVQVVGYDDIPVAGYFSPALTTVRQPVDLAGRMLVDLLHERLAGRAAPSCTLPTELVVRDSTGSKPAKAAGRARAKRAHLPLADGR